MKRYISPLFHLGILVFSLLLAGGLVVFPVFASPTTSINSKSFNTSLALKPFVATEAATPTATSEGNFGLVEQKQIEQKPVDITQPSEVKSKLAEYLDQTTEAPLRPWNAIQHVIRNAVQHGIPANILVLLLLFPATTSIIAIFRHVVGLRGFGIYTPAVLAVAFISLGIGKGLLLFFVVFGTVLIGRPLLDWVHLQYLPRTAILVWFVSSAMFLLLAVSPYLPLPDLTTIGIFPLLMLVLLSEHFLEAQLAGSLGKALQLTGETLVLAIISALFMRTFEVQKIVIIYPEITMLFVLIIDILVGKYTGLRFSEFFRFKPLIDPEE